MFLEVRTTNSLLKGHISLKRKKKIIIRYFNYVISSWYEMRQFILLTQVSGTTFLSKVLCSSWTEPVVKVSEDQLLLLVIYLNLKLKKMLKRTVMVVRGPSVLFITGIGEGLKYLL